MSPTNPARRSGARSSKRPAPSARAGTKADRTRLRLVDAVRREIEDTGSISAGAVARRAESSPATFYNHFASKEEAVLAAFDAAMADLVAFVDERLDVARALELGLVEFLRAWSWSAVEFFRANSVVFDAARTYTSRSDPFRQVFRAREAEALDAYTRFVRLGQRAGLVRDGDTDAIAEMLMLTSQGWNHARILRCKRGGALHEELVRSVHAALTQADEAWRDDA